MIGFEPTPTGYRATDAQVAYWESRDTCPLCTAIVEPIGTTPTGAHAYRCHCEPGNPVEWTR